MNNSSMSKINEIDELLSRDEDDRKLAFKKIRQIGFHSFENTDFIFGYLAATILLDSNNRELIECICEENYPVSLNTFISERKKYADHDSLHESFQSDDFASYIVDAIYTLDTKYLDGFCSSILIFIGSNINTYDSYIEDNYYIYFAIKKTITIPTDNFFKAIVRSSSFLNFFDEGRTDYSLTGYYINKFNLTNELIYEIASSEDFVFLPEDKKSADICRYAVQCEPYNIRFVPNKYLTEPMIITAVKQESHVLVHIKKEMRSEKVYLAAIESKSYYPELFRHLPEKYITQDLCLKGISHNSSDLKYVPDEFKTVEIIKKALRKAPSNIKYIPEPIKNKILIQLLT